MQQLLSTAISAALEAGQAILDVYQFANVEVEYKDDRTPLTQADRASHNVIARHLSNTPYPLLSEEDAKNHDYSERSKWEWCWIVDPLDGTKEFIKRNGEFTVNIALAEHGKPVLGVIFTPVQDILHFAAEGKGAFRLENASKILPEEFFSKAVALPLQPLPARFTIVGSRSHASEETNAYVNEQQKKYGDVDFIAAGSSLKFCLVAEGKAHAYPRFASTMEWDTAAGQIIVEQAGGRMVEWPSQQPIVYNRKELRNTWFLVQAVKEP